MGEGEGETFWRRGEHPRVSPSPNLPARLAPSPFLFKDFQLYRIPLAGFPGWLLPGNKDES